MARGEIRSYKAGVTHQQLPTVAPSILQILATTADNEELQGKPSAEIAGVTAGVDKFFHFVSSRHQSIATYIQRFRATEHYRDETGSDAKLQGDRSQ
jgi:hypothetical protein